jgi:myo-inositol-1(or 4)-monophosphatase
LSVSTGELRDAERDREQVHPGDLRHDLERIEAAVRRAGALLVDFAHRDLDVEQKAPGHPVTEADRAADDLLRGLLPADGDGWLSEETEDDPARLDRRRVWIVDPLDGTKEFIAGIPEWSVSVALAVDGRPVAGGVYNPVQEHLVLGAVGLGVTLNGEPVAMTDPATFDGARVLASRSEMRRGEWHRFEAAGLEVVPTGSVAYKLALVAAGLADATWTLCPKSEWDVAAGAALVAAGGGRVTLPDGAPPAFNKPRPRFPGFLAAGSRLAGRLPALVTEGGNGDRKGRK